MLRNTLSESVSKTVETSKISHLEKLIKKQKGSLDYFFNEIDLEKLAHIFTVVQNKPQIFLTGIGKSAFVAKKIAHMLKSIGQKAFFLSAVDAMHGDLGMVEKNDCVLFFSKSGSTQELLDLIPFLKQKKIETISICNVENSKLASMTEHTVTLPLDEELCPFNLAPTTSASLQMLFGDLLVVFLMQENQFTLDHYALNHPAGFIGKNLTLTVDELMIKEPNLPLVHKDEIFSKALLILTKMRVGCLLVVDNENHFLGIFTDGDLKRALMEHPNLLDLKMGELMIKTNKMTTPHALVKDVLKTMQKDPMRIITQMPVIENDKVVGLIRTHEIIQAGLI